MLKNKVWVDGVRFDIEQKIKKEEGYRQQASGDLAIRFAPIHEGTRILSAALGLGLLVLATWLCRQSFDSSWFRYVDRLVFWLLLEGAGLAVLVSWIRHEVLIQNGRLSTREGEVKIQEIDHFYFDVRSVGKIWLRFHTRNGSTHSLRFVGSPERGEFLVDQLEAFCRKIHESTGELEPELEREPRSSKRFNPT